MVVSEVLQAMREQDLEKLEQLLADKETAMQILLARRENGFTNDIIKDAIFYSRNDSLKLLVEAARKLFPSQQASKDYVGYAVFINKPKVAEFLMEQGYSPNVVPRDCPHAIISAAQVRNDDTSIITLLVKHGVDIRYRCGDGDNALHAAIRSGNEKIAEMLINLGIEFDLSERRGYTALALAAYRGMADICNLLIDKGADVNSATNSNETPLSLLLVHSPNKVWELAKKIVGNGYSFAKENATFNTLLDKLVCNTEWLDLFVKEGWVNINDTDSEGYSLLYYAITHRNVASVKYLIANGVDVNRKEPDERSPVIRAAICYGKSCDSSFDDDERDDSCEILNLIENRLSESN